MARSMGNERRLQALRGVGARRTVTALVSLCVAGVAASGSQAVVRVSEQATATAQRDAVVAQALGAPPIEVPQELSLLPGDAGLPIARDHRARLVEGIPQDALEAYQRAAQILESSAPRCRLEWTMIAAIGQIESRHGTLGGGRLNADGLVTPALVGPSLDGRGGRERVVDTDAGQLDGDRRFDRRLGPFRITPSTWRVVGVDADGDGERNPQSILDSAVGAGVALCGDGDDLGTSMGRKLALRGYNPDRAFAERVLALADDYELEGTHTTTPTAVPASAQADLDLILSQASIAPTSRPAGSTRPRTEAPRRPQTGTPSRPGSRPDAGTQPSPWPARDLPKPRLTPSPSPTPGPTPDPGPSCPAPEPTPTDPSPTPVEPTPTDPAAEPTAPSTDPAVTDPDATEPTPTEPTPTEPTPTEPGCG